MADLDGTKGKFIAEPGSSGHKLTYIEDNSVDKFPNAHYLGIHITGNSAVLFDALIKYDGHSSVKRIIEKSGWDKRNPEWFYNLIDETCRKLSDGIVLSDYKSNKKALFKIENPYPIISQLVNNFLQYKGLEPYSWPKLERKWDLMTKNQDLTDMGLFEYKVKKFSDFQ